MCWPPSLVVAEERSFTRAARRLMVSPSALSHAIRGLEERLGVRLLARTTRSVAPTEAGEQLLGGCSRRWAMYATRSISSRAWRSAGRACAAGRLAGGGGARAGAEARRVRADPPGRDAGSRVRNDRVDLVAGRFDAGIQLGEFVERDMIAVRVSPDQRAAIVASPEYLAAHPKPESPRDLTRHRCINFHRGEAGLYRWEFERDGYALSVAVEGPLIVDDLDLLLRSAIDGAGLAFAFEQHVTPHLASGALVRVLEDVVSAVPRLLRLLRDAPPAAARARGADRRAPPLTRCRSRPRRRAPIPCGSCRR